MWNIEIYFVYFLALSMGWSPALGEDNQLINKIREPRHSKNKLCYKYGICGGFGNQGYQGYQGYHGGYNQGGYYPGYIQGGYHGGYDGSPPINIAISQSQNSANAGGGGFGSSSYPNNYQYNGGYNGHHGADRPGYLSFGGFGGFGGFGYNNPFNGNYHGGGGGYGFQRPFGYGDDYTDDGNNENYERSAKSKDSTD